MPEIDLDHLRRWIGRERVMEDPLQPFPARALAAALDRRALPGEGDALPPAWQWLYFLDTPAAAATGRDGHPSLGEFLPPAPLPRRMWAAGSFEVEHPLKLGEPARRTTRIQSVDAKSGKSGSLVFVNLEHRVEQDGRLCLREEQNLVYRELPAGPQPLPAGERAPVAADWSRTVTPDPVLLFRYSALTYNGHRIHYDRQYAVEHEFYPALVVHGPLLASLILELVATELPQARVRQFRFRAVRPTFDTQPFRVCGRREAATLHLWTADHEGQLCMTATAVLA